MSPFQNIMLSHSLYADTDGGLLTFWKLTSQIVM